MKNNSFKQFGPLSKKLALTALLATVLSGPYVYQVSSKDFHFEEFASTAAETATALADLDKEQIAYRVDLETLIERLKKANTDKYGSLTYKSELPKPSEIPDEALKKSIVTLEAQRTALEEKRAENERAKRIKEAEQKRRDELAAADKAEKERREAAEKAEKEKKEKEAEAKRLDCNDKDKDAAEKRECREEAKRAEKERKAEEASKKFDDKLETAWRFCESRSEKTKSSTTRTSDSAEDIELACKSRTFMSALRSQGKNLEMSAVNAQFKHLLGDDLFKMLYSDDERDAERASIILSNIFNGKVPSQFAGLKRMIMDEVRRRADAPAKKVQAEFKKANQFAVGSTERFAQTNVAIAAKTELDNRITAYSASMYDPMYAIRDTDALSYYKTSYQKGLDALSLRIMSGMTITGGEKGGATRGGEVRGGTTTEARVVTTADGKMVRGSGVEYSLVSPGTISNITFGTPSSTRSSSGTRGGVRVAN